MPRARRTRWLFLYCADEPTLDVARLLRGELETGSVRQLYGISILTGTEHPISRAELDRLLALPDDRWVEIDDNASIGELAAKGLVLMDRCDDAHLQTLRERDEQLTQDRWNLYGALYHSMNRWHDVDVGLTEYDTLEGLAAEALAAFVSSREPAPPHFHTYPRATAVRDLPIVERTGGVFDALGRRRTSRLFDPTSITEDELATLLRYTFGCHGVAPLDDVVVGLRKTSPSGGGLHPVEAYPLILRVAGLEPGLYHYDVARHALELVERLTPDEAERLATEFTCGQGYFAQAAALVVLTARFERSFWKYRTHERAYAVLLMDAAHLSQTFYLVCAELGLGAFFTGAVNSANIDERLGLDGFREGTIAISGCGRRADRPSVLEPEFLPYVPQRG